MVQPSNSAGRGLVPCKHLMLSRPSATHDEESGQVYKIGLLYLK